MGVPDCFHPFAPLSRGGCFTCTHFHGRYNGDALLCEQPGGVRSVGVPARGCCYWEREPGADDEIHERR
jgi:hypothetical protein